MYFATMFRNGMHSAALSRHGMRCHCPVLFPCQSHSCFQATLYTMTNGFIAHNGVVASRHSSSTVARDVAAQAVKAREAAADQYDATRIQVLEGLEPVRKRPGMYIGSTGQRGLHHLVYEVLDNSIDEVQAGHATLVQVEVDVGNGWVTITDNGRGIPTDVHPATGKSALETVLTVLHAGGKFGGDSSGYSVSGGLHGVGISVVNALSQDLHVSVYRRGVQYSQRYSQGVPQTPLEEASCAPERIGTCVSFLYDPTIFAKSASYDPDTLASRLRELAFLNPAAHIHFRVKKDGVVVPPKVPKGVVPDTSNPAVADGWQIFHATGGLQEYVAWLNRDNTPLHKPIAFGKMVDGIKVEVSLQWCSDVFSDTLLGFVNSIRTVDGGTHLDGTKTALTRTVNSLARKLKVLKDGDPNLSGDHIREGLAGVVSVSVPNPEFEGQTKTRLGNPEVKKIVEGVVAQYALEALELDPTTFGAVVSKALQAAKAAAAAKQARELVRRKNVLTKSTLPGKLADCTGSDKASSEIFIVEGDSAGGSAKQARDRRFQAVLPLRGKILNVERKEDAALYKNNEISSLIVALGLGVKGEATTANLRYGKVILLTDADVDGAHIRTLLLTFLFRYARQLFEEGRVYVGCPPLYKVEAGAKQVHYCYDDQELQQILSTLSESTKYTIQRFKGLGEMMPEQLWSTTLDPATRMLRRLTIEDAAEASHMFALLMGDKVGPRRELIEQYAGSMHMQELDI